MKSTENAQWISAKALRGIVSRATLFKLSAAGEIESVLIPRTGKPGAGLKVFSKPDLIGWAHAQTIKSSRRCPAAERILALRKAGPSNDRAK